MSSNSIVGVYTDEHMVLDSIKKLKSLKMKIRDVYGPFADHAILQAVTKPTRLPHLAFVFAAGAALSTLAFTYWTSVINYPLHYGGKPVFAFPALVVIIYLVTILGTATLSVFAFLARQRMFPGKKADQPGDRANDDLFYIILDRKNDTDDLMIEKLMKESGASKVIFDK